MSSSTNIETSESGRHAVTNSRRLFLKGIHLPNLPTHIQPPKLATNVSHRNLPTWQKLQEQSQQQKEAIKQRKELFRVELERFFAPYDVQEIFIPEHKRKKFAIITLTSIAQANKALISIQSQEQEMSSKSTLASSGAFNKSQAVPPYKLLFDEIRPGNDLQLPVNASIPNITASTTTTCQYDKEKHLVDLEKLRRISISANFVIQCSKSHFDRILDVLHTAMTSLYKPSVKIQQDDLNLAATTAVTRKTDPLYPLTVLGHHNYKDLTLIFCRYDDHETEKNSSESDPSSDTFLHLLAHWLESTWYIRNNIQRIYIFNHIIENNLQHQFSSLPQKIPPINDEMKRKSSINNNNKNKEHEKKNDDRHYPQSEKVNLRLCTFPPRLQAPLLEVMEKEDDHIVCTPDRNSANYTWNVLELLPRRSSSLEGLYLSGISSCCSLPPSQKEDFPAPEVSNKTYETADNNKESSSSSNRSSNNSSNKGMSESCCRAYWKLQEAVECFPYKIPTRSGGIGLDVGSSPGGWTQFLIQQGGCEHVYSIDPGAMDHRVIELTAHQRSHQDGNDKPETKRRPKSAVQHIPMTYQKGLPEVALLRPENKKQVQWYVSDMCVKTLSEQIDALLLAVDQRLVDTDTFIILTLKCSRGHSKITYERLVEEQVSRIKEKMRHLHVLHLFANRQSERTVMGFWK